jgi:hypothetical protein
MSDRRGRLAARVAVALVVPAVAAGCFAPPPVGSDRDKLVEIVRVPLPVPPGADGDWHLLVDRAAIVGEGRHLAAFDPDGGLRWTLQLPDSYALTARPGLAHSGLMTGRGEALLLLAGAPGGDGPTSVRALSPLNGTPLWERTLPPGARVTVLDETVVLGRCGAAGCELTAVDAIRGTDTWHATVSGTSMILVDGTDASRDHRGDHSAVPRTMWLAGEHFVVPVASNGAVGSTRPRAPGPPGRVVTIGNTLVLIAPPAGADCTATLTGYATTASYPVTWTRQVSWDDPRAARDANGCRYDPDQPVVRHDDLVVPDRDGALEFAENGYQSGRLDPGDFPVADRLVADADGRYRTWPGRETLAVPAPTRPAWAMSLPGGSTVVRDRDGLTVCDRPTCAAPRWRVRGGRTALLPSQFRLLFLTGDTVISVGTAGTKPKRSPSPSPATRHCIPISGGHQCPGG